MNASDPFYSQTPHLLQSPLWGQFKAEFGWEAEVFRSRDAWAQVLFRRLPLGLSIAYLPKGPVGLNWAQLWGQIDAACKRRGAIFLQVEPDLSESEISPDLAQQFQGFNEEPRTIQPRSTILIDLRAEEGELLARMKQKTRYNIRLAERKGIVVAQGTADDLSDFYRLLRVTGERASFGVHTLDYYRRAWSLFRERDSVALFLARYSGRTLAAILVIAWGKTAYYMYGGSSDEERQRMPTYLLQWEAMRWAKARGCQLYDLWGIPDVDESKVGEDIQAAEASGVLSHGMGGLYRFKRGFGGQETRYIGACDAVLNPVLYPLMMALRTHRNQAQQAQ